MARSNARAIVLFVWRRSPPPYFLGGAEISQGLLASELVKAGYEVRYLGSFDEPWPGGTRIRDELMEWLRQAGIEPCYGSPRGSGEISYRWKGIQCRICASEDLSEALWEELDRKPQVVLASQEEGDELLRAAATTDALTLGWIHSITDTGLLAAKAKPTELLCVSRFVQKNTLRQFRRPGHLFYPPFRPVCTAATGSRTGHLTIVNPIPEKGGDLFVELAHLLPQREFLAVDGWYPAALPTLPNVRRLRRPAAMAEVWRGTSLLLVPSQIEEGFGRVCVEAGQRRVPSLVSGRGGLPEAVGPGGCTVKSNDASAWAEEIERMLNAEVYEALGDAARQHASRFERDPVKELVAAGLLP